MNIPPTSVHVYSVLGSEVPFDVIAQTLTLYNVPGCSPTKSER